MRRVFVLHGPNLSLLGRREPEIYGHTTLREIDARLQELAGHLGLEVRCAQCEGEGEMVKALHGALEDCQAVLINPAAYTHTSLAIRDALAALADLGIPSVEVHLSQPAARESFRHTSLTAPVCRGSIAGFGPNSYLLGLRAIAAILDGEVRSDA